MKALRSSKGGRQNTKPKDANIVDNSNQKGNQKADLSRPNDKVIWMEAAGDYLRGGLGGKTLSQDRIASDSGFFVQWSFNGPPPEPELFEAHPMARSPRLVQCMITPKSIIDPGTSLAHLC